MTEKEKYLIWERVMGYVNDNGEIESLFEPGSECSQLWEKIYQYEMNIVEKLGGKDCDELEKMWGCYHEICRLVSFKMFDYGEKNKGK